MPNPINNVTLAGTDYTDQATIADVWQAIGGAFQIANGRVYYAVQYRLDPKHSGFGNFAWSTDILLPPGSGTIPEGVIGVKFRNADPAQPATIISAAIATSFAPVLSLNSVSSIASTMITGRISSGGVALAGSGFTVNRTGTGAYTITFTTAFSTPPTVLTTTAQASSAATVAVTSVAAGSFTTQANTFGSVVDVDWNFVAFATV